MVAKKSIFSSFPVGFNIELRLNHYKQSFRNIQEMLLRTFTSTSNIYDRHQLVQAFSCHLISRRCFTVTVFVRSSTCSLAPNHIPMSHTSVNITSYVEQCNELRYELLRTSSPLLWRNSPNSSENIKISCLLSGCDRRDRCPQVGWRRARGGKHLASGLEWAPLVPMSRPAVGLHLRPRHRTESV